MLDPLDLEFIDDYETPCGCWELNPGVLCKSNKSS